MKTLATLFALCVVALAGSAQAFPPPTAASKSSQAEQRIRQLSAAEVRALMAHDTRILAQLWSDDFVVTNPFNKFVGKPQVLQLVTANQIAFTSYARRIEYLRVHGDTAVVAGSETVAWAGNMRLAGKTSELRFTSVWMQQTGRWQEVARHANIVSTR